MKANLNRRLQELEATRPAQKDQAKAREHARARMIVEDQETLDLANRFFDLVATGATDEEIEPVARALNDRLTALETARGWH